MLYILYTLYFQLDNMPDLFKNSPLCHSLEVPFFFSVLYNCVIQILYRLNFYWSFAQIPCYVCPATSRGVAISHVCILSLFFLIGNILLPCVAGGTTTTSVHVFPFGPHVLVPYI
jgi:hypothetical protein